MHCMCGGDTVPFLLNVYTVSNINVLLGNTMCVFQFVRDLREMKFDVAACISDINNVNMATS